ncbi:MAG: hypothetical protein R3E01_36250 [Pirellulaceae bacterium]
MMLGFLDAIAGLADRRGVKNILALQGQCKSTYRMHVTSNCCITFQYDGEDVINVGFEYYH